MSTNYEQLVDFLKKNCDEKTNIGFYIGIINGEYKVSYNKDDKEILDNIISDGQTSRTVNSCIIDDASYVCIVRYRNSDPEKSSGELDKIDLLIDQDYVENIMMSIGRADNNLLKKMFSPTNNKGNVSEYQMDMRYGLAIYPSSELIECNKKSTTRKK